MLIIFWALIKYLIISSWGIPSEAYFHKSTFVRNTQRSIPWSKNTLGWYTGGAPVRMTPWFCAWPQRRLVAHQCVWPHRRWVLCSGWCGTSPEHADRDGCDGADVTRAPLELGCRNLAFLSLLFCHSWPRFEQILLKANSQKPSAKELF